jgi:hypothetical protein
MLERRKTLGKVFGAGSMRLEEDAPMNCQKCGRVWYKGPKMNVMVPETSGDWREEMWCLGCVIKQGNLEMLEVE